MMMPGRTLHRLAARICSERSLARIVEPAIADLQNEFSITSGNAVHRGWVLVRGYAAIVKVVGMCALSISTTDDEGQAITRTLGWFLALFIGVTGLLMLLPLSNVDGRIVRLVFLPGLIPQAMPLAIPIAVTFAIAFGMAGATTTRATVKAVLLAVAVASVVSFVTLAWVMPAGNQAYRESIARAAGHSGSLIKGHTEMTLSELDREAAIAAAVGNTRRADGYAWSFHLRFALSMAAIALATFLFAIAGKGAVSRGVLALFACLAYWALIYAGEILAVRDASIPPFAGAWLPNLVFVVSTIIVVSSRSWRSRV